MADANKRERKRKAVRESMLEKRMLDWIVSRSRKPHR